MDWLHCVDQGVASTLLGCIFYITIRRKEVGCNITVRTDAFWSRVQGPRLLYTSYHNVCMLHVCMVYVCCMYGISLYDTSGFYERKKVQDQITGFTYTLVKQNQKKTHLRCSAAQARALIPFGKELVDELFDDSNPEELAAKTAMGHMFECYEALHGADDFVGRLTLHSRLFALQFVALEEYFSGTWSQSCTSALNCV